MQLLLQLLYEWSIHLRHWQISTWKEDYLIDTIALHDTMATLRPVFANPAIVKV